MGVIRLHRRHRTYISTVSPPSIEETLESAEEAVAAGRALSGTGFWPLVRRLKTSPELVERYGERVAAIDQRAFENWALLRIPLGLGTILAVVALGVGLALIGWSYSLAGLVAVVVFGAGVVVLLVSTHGLAHLVVGWLVGMRFTCWFVGEIRQPQPGVKIDYATYLRTPARSRAWMHAAGAIVTKAVPFLMIPAAIAADLPVWVVWVLVIAGVAMVLTDIFWSTGSSDWKKFSREMSFAQD